LPFVCAGLTTQLDSNILLIASAAGGAAILAIIVIIIIVIVIYCLARSKRDKATSVQPPKDSADKSDDYLYDEIGKGTALSVEYDYAKCSNKGPVYEYPKRTPGDRDYIDPRLNSFQMTKTNAAYGVLSNSVKLQTIQPNAAYAAVNTVEEEDHIYSEAERL